MDGLEEYQAYAELIKDNLDFDVLVETKFLKLNMSHIEYVMDCLQKNTTKVRNIKSYLLTTLFNASSTMDSYYRAMVNYDMPQFAGQI